jgi:hypothetical protein
MMNTDDERTLHLCLSRRELNLLISSLIMVPGEEVENLLWRLSDLHRAPGAQQPEENLLKEMALAA